MSRIKRGDKGDDESDTRGEGRHASDGARGAAKTAQNGDAVRNAAVCEESMLRVWRYNGDAELREEKR